MFNLEQFISTYVTKRQISMFLPDIEKNREILSNKITNKTVCVIGGAGSIGSSFIKAILPFRPASLVVVDTNENALAELTRDIRSTKGMFIPANYVTYPMDFASPVFKKMDLLVKYPPEEYFCVSTDKAANPVNIMGASKRIMEDVIFSYSDKFPVKTARFANVAFSNGSLPAGFLERIHKQQPLSAPSDVRRYFVSPEESGQICMLACMLGENRAIFFPKLKEAQMMTFDAIGTELLKAYNYEVIECTSDEEAIDKAEDLKHGSNQYPVHYSISDTSGEKAFEEFVTNTEMVDMERFFSLGVIIGKEIPDKVRLKKLFTDLDITFKKAETTKEEVIKIMKEYLPNFEHIETGKFLDDKM